MKTYRMEPADALRRADQMLDEINRLRASIADEVSEITELWDGLGNAGGQRDDHAAALLARLRPALDALSSFCANVSQQIANMITDPFNTKGGAE